MADFTQEDIDRLKELSRQKTQAAVRQRPMRRQPSGGGSTALLQREPGQGLIAQPQPTTEGITGQISFSNREAQIREAQRRTAEQEQRAAEPRPSLLSGVGTLLEAGREYTEFPAGLFTSGLQNIPTSLGILGETDFQRKQSELTEQGLHPLSATTQAFVETDMPATKVNPFEAFLKGTAGLLGAPTSLQDKIDESNIGIPLPFGKRIEDIDIGLKGLSELVFDPFNLLFLGSGKAGQVARRGLPRAQSEAFKESGKLWDEAFQARMPREEPLARWEGPRPTDPKDIQMADDIIGQPRTTADRGPGAQDMQNIRAGIPIKGRKSSDEWAKMYEEATGKRISDPDGWDRQNFDASWGELISQTEFERRLGRSTLVPMGQKPLVVARPEERAFTTEEIRTRELQTIIGRDSIGEMLADRSGKAFLERTPLLNRIQSKRLTDLTDQETTDVFNALQREPSGSLKQFRDVLAEKIQLNGGYVRDGQLKFPSRRLGDWRSEAERPLGPSTTADPVTGARMAGEGGEEALSIPERYSRDWRFGTPVGEEPLQMGTTGQPLRGMREDAANVFNTRGELKAEISRLKKTIQDEKKNRRRAAGTGEKKERLAEYTASIERHGQDVAWLQSRLNALPKLPKVKIDPLENLIERIRSIPQAALRHTERLAEPTETKKIVGETYRREQKKALAKDLEQIGAEGIHQRESRKALSAAWKNRLDEVLEPTGMARDDFLDFMKLLQDTPPERVIRPGMRQLQGRRSLEGAVDEGFELTPQQSVAVDELLGQPRTTETTDTLYSNLKNMIDREVLRGSDEFLRKNALSMNLARILQEQTGIDATTIVLKMSESERIVKGIYQREYEKALRNALKQSGMTKDDFLDLQKSTPGADIMDVNRIAQEQTDINLRNIIDAGERRIAKEIAKRGPGGNTQRLPMNATSRAEADANVFKEMFEPVDGSRIDEAASAYLRTKQWPAYIEGMGPASKDFPVHPSFAAQPMRNIGAFTRYTADSTRFLEAMDRGVFGDAAQKYIGWPTRRTDLAGKEFAKTHKIAHRKLQEEYGMVASLGEELTPSIGPLREHGTFKRTQMLRGLAGDVVEEISSNDIIVPVRELLARPNIARWLKKITPEEQVQVVGYAQKARPFLDDIFVKQNQARVARGQDPIPYIEKYRPWIMERNIWSRMGFGRESAQRFGEKAEIPDFITPKAWFNPRAQQRAGGLQDYWKQRDLGKLIDDYVETATKDIFHTNIIQNAKPYIKNLRDRKLGGAAKAIEGWIMESYAGVKPPISKYAIKGEEALGEFVGTSIPVRRGIFAIRKNLARAVFPFNWVWNLTTQSASLANTYMRYGATRTIQGQSYITNPTIRREVLDNAYGAKVKQMRSGRAAYQEAGRESIAEIERRPIEKVEDFANYITNKLEENLTGVSTQAARKEAESMGLTGRAMWEYASEGGSKTQSMYNTADVPALLRAPEVGSVVPFQTFSFNMMNDALETLPYIVPERLRVGAYAGVRLPSGQIGKTGITGTTQYELLGRTVTVQNRLKALARWTAGITAFAIVADNVMGRQPWKLSSFVPFFGLLTNGAGVGNPYNDPLMYKYFADFTKAVKAYFKYGNWEKLRTWVIGYHMIGGSQMNRTIKGIEAVADGKVTDVRGETLFDLDPPGSGLWGLIPSEYEGKWEAFKAITQGPYAVSEGRKYVEGLKGGVVEEYLGLNLGKWTEDEEDKIRRLTSQYSLEIQGDKTTWFDIKEHNAVRDSIKSTLPLHLRDKVDEYIDSSSSERLELEKSSDFTAIGEALDQEYKSGGTIDELKKEFLKAAPIGWWYVAARAGIGIPGSKRLRNAINAWIEEGNEFPDIDYKTFSGDFEKLEMYLEDNL